MKNQMYITLLILPLLATGCEGRKETAQTMPVPEISVFLNVNTSSISASINK